MRLFKNKYGELVDEDGRGFSYQNVITIHYDFATGEELPFHQARKTVKSNNASFSTNCLHFFQSCYINAKIIRKDGREMSVKGLLEDASEYTVKDLRRAHNLSKMLIAGAFSKFTDE